MWAALAPVIVSVLFKLMEYFLDKAKVSKAFKENFHKFVASAQKEMNSPVKLSDSVDKQRKDLDNLDKGENKS